MADSPEIPNFEAGAFGRTRDKYCQKWEYKNTSHTTSSTPPPNPPYFVSDPVPSSSRPIRGASRTGCNVVGLIPFILFLILGVIRAGLSIGNNQLTESQTTFNSGKNHLELGLSYQEVGDTEKTMIYFSLAIQEFDRAIQEKPDFSEAFDHRGLVYQARGNYSQAIADGSKAIELKPASAMAYNNRGTSYHASGDLDKALADYSQAIQLNKKFGKAYFNRGLILYARGQYDQAISDFGAAIDNSSPIFDLKGNTSPQGKKFVDSLLKTAALESDEADRPMAYTYRGMAYSAAGNDSLAFSDFTQALQLREDLSIALYNQGLIYLLRGNVDQAEANFKKVLEVNNDPDAQAAAQAMLDSLGFFHN